MTPELGLGVFEVAKEDGYPWQTHCPADTGDVIIKLQSLPLPVPGLET